MRKIIVALFFGVALGVAHGQISNPPLFLVGTTIVSGLPPAASATNQFWGVTDGASATDCATGSGTTGVVCWSNGIVWAAIGGGGAGSGTVTTFSAGALSPLFTTSVANPTTTPALTFSLSSAAANTVFGNFTGGSAAPTFSATPTFNAVNLTGAPALAITNMTGTGTNLTFVNPALGTPASGTLTNATGLPISTGVSGLGTGVATLLGGTSSGTGGPAGTASPTFTGNVLASSASATLGVTATGASASYNTGNDLNSALTAGAGHILYRCFGQGLTTNNSTCLTFNYTLAASATNYGYFSLFGGVSPLAWYGNGGVSVGASTTTPPANGLLSAGPIISGITKFTVSGCGVGGSLLGNGAAGSFTVGTGATNCTFTITINGATGMTATNGWIANADDTTAKIHCTNSTTVSTTTMVFDCTGTVATSDLIKFSGVPY